MKKTSIKILALTLAVLMLIPFAVSCKKDSEAGAPNAENVDKTIDYQAILGFGPEDNNGYEFTILASTTDASEHDAKELNSNFVNDAVFKRNIAVQDFFNIKLKVQVEPGDYSDKASFNATITTPITAGDNQHDLIVGVTAVIADTLGSDYYLPVNKINHIDLSKEWWVAGQFDKLQINNNIYSVYGDMNLSLYSEIHSFIFNVQMIDHNSLLSPYARVSNNSWTYANMVADTMAVGAPGTADGVTIEDDTFGMIGTTNPQRALLTGFGLDVIVRNTENNRPEIPEQPDQTYIEAYNMVSDAFTNNEYNLLKHAKADNDYSDHLTALAQNRCLYLPAYTYWITDPILTGMQGDFGLVPYPKLSAEQTSYYSQIATGATATLFPKSLTTVDLSAKVATYMSYVGNEMVAKPYFDNYLKERLARSPEMQTMLETVRSTATMTLSTVYHTALTGGQILQLFEVSETTNWNGDGKGGVASEFKSRYPSYRTSIKQLLKKYADD